MLRISQPPLLCSVEYPGYDKNFHIYPSFWHDVHISTYTSRVRIDHWISVTCDGHGIASFSRRYWIPCSWGNTSFSWITRNQSLIGFLFIPFPIFYLTEKSSVMCVTKKNVTCVTYANRYILTQFWWFLIIIFWFVSTYNVSSNVKQDLDIFDQILMFSESIWEDWEFSISNVSF